MGALGLQHEKLGKEEAEQCCKGATLPTSGVQGGHSHLDLEIL